MELDNYMISLSSQFFKNNSVSHPPPPKKKIDKISMTIKGLRQKKDQTKYFSII